MALTLGFATPGARPGNTWGMQSKARETELMGETGKRSWSGKTGNRWGQGKDTSSGWRMGRDAGADQSQVLAVPKFYTAKFSETHRQINYSLEFLVDNPTPTPYCDLAIFNKPGTCKKGNNSLIKAVLIC